MLHIDGDDCHVERDLVEDEIVADGIDGLLIARDLRSKECREVVDGVRGLDSSAACTDVFVRVVVRNGGKCNVWIRCEFDDLFVVLERGEVDAAFLGCVVEVHDAYMRQPVRRRRECDLALLAHDALEFIPHVHVFPSIPTYHYSVCIPRTKA